MLGQTGPGLLRSLPCLVAPSLSDAVMLCKKHQNKPKPMPTNWNSPTPTKWNSPAFLTQGTRNPPRGLAWPHIIIPTGARNNSRLTLPWLPYTVWRPPLSHGKKQKELWKLTKKFGLPVKKRTGALHRGTSEGLGTCAIAHGNHDKHNEKANRPANIRLCYFKLFPASLNTGLHPIQNCRRCPKLEKSQNVLQAKQHIAKSPRAFAKTIAPLRISKGTKGAWCIVYTERRKTHPM